MMKPDIGIAIAIVDWHQQETALSQLRQEVFIEEQQVPEALEWDGLDDQCIQILATNQTGQAIGCARLTPQGQIGRMAVIKDFRRQGIGARMLRELLHTARQQGHTEVFLHAQTDAIAFYTPEGFKIEGDVYDEAGIPHQTMRLTF